MNLKLYQPSTILDFGKYKGHSVEYVLANDPEYLIWCANNISGFGMSKSVKDALEEVIWDDGYDYDDPFIWEDFVNH